MKRILLLGGVGDALKTARRLGPQDIYSLAGVGRQPSDLPCQLRVGGYGGIEGLSSFIREQHISLLLDITHPYAAQISAHAAQAAQNTGIPCWALRRPAWQATAQDRWHEVTDWPALIQVLQGFQRPFFTNGREPLKHLAEIPSHQFWTIRVLDEHPAPTQARIIAARGPFQWEDERALFAAGRFDVLITKNSGGSATEPKLQVARELGLPVFLMSRPTLPDVDQIFESLEALWQQLPARN